VRYLAVPGRCLHNFGRWVDYWEEKRHGGVDSDDTMAEFFGLTWQ
jgi:hypothetical protein